MPEFDSLFMESFESYQNEGSLEGDWFNGDSGQLGFGTSQFDGQRSLNMRGANTDTDRFVRREFGVAGDYVIFGARCYFANFAPTSGFGQHRGWITLRDGAGVRVHIKIETGGIARVRFGSVSGTDVLVVNDFAFLDGEHFYEVEIYRHASNGFVGLYRDGGLIGSFSGDTSGISSSMDRIDVRNPGTSVFGPDRVHMRDVYVATVSSWSTIGGNVLGPGVCRDLVPGADVSTDFTRSTGSDSFALLGKPNDGDTSYTESDTVGHEDLFSPNVSDLPEGTILAVGVYVAARQSEAGPMDFGGVMESGAERIAPPGVSLEGANYRGRLLVPMRVTDPDDDGAWNPTRVGNLSFGYRNVAV